jgi:hypothetical protein
MIPEPIISDKFTIADIHKIREYHREVTRNMTLEEKRDFYKEGRIQIEKEIQLIREEKARKRMAES